jgi:hypothetical protein
MKRQSFKPFEAGDHMLAEFPESKLEAGVQYLAIIVYHKQMIVLALLAAIRNPSTSTCSAHTSSASDTLALYFLFDKLVPTLFKLNNSKFSHRL